MAPPVRVDDGYAAYMDWALSERGMRQFVSPDPVAVPEQPPTLSARAARVLGPLALAAGAAAGTLAYTSVTAPAPKRARKTDESSSTVWMLPIR